MEPAYWQARWARGETGWHRDEVMPLLARHWPSLAVPAGSQVLVPLCGKTLDMAWLAGEGHRVLGIELAAEGIEAFFAGQSLRADVTETTEGRLHHAGPLSILEADAFSVPAERLADCRAVYDRAALIALPPELRRRYAETTYARLPTGCRGLLITLECPQAEKQGPPFSVEEAEVRALFEPEWQVSLLDRRDILAQQPAFMAEGALATAVYRLDKR